MGDIKDGFESTFRPFAVDGVPASGPNKPSKAEAAALGGLIEFDIAAAAAAVSGDGIAAIKAAVQPLVDDAEAAVADARAAADAADASAQQVATTFGVDQQSGTPASMALLATNRRVAASVGGKLTSLGAAKVRDLRVGKIGDRPASSVVAFFGNGGIQRDDIVYLLNLPYGQSLSLAANSSINGNTGVITTVQRYGNVMFKGGVRFLDGLDMTQFVPHVESIGENGGAGETICGGYDSMLAQIFNAYNMPPLRQGMKTVSYAPGLGESPIDAFLEGTGIFDRLLQGVQAAVDLSGGKKVVVGSIKWMQGESRGDNTIATTITKLGQLAEALDRRIRAITGQTEPVRLRTYQYPLGDAGAIFPVAARQYPLIQIVGPIYDLKSGGLVNGSAQFDIVHRAAEGYFMYGARCAVVDFCEIYLKRPWRPLQIARDAQGRVRCRRIDADHLLVRYDVPFDGELVFDDTNLLIGGFRATGAVFQNGFFALDANGANIPLRDVSVYSRNEVLLAGTNIATAGNTINVGSPLLTRFGAPSVTAEPGYNARTTLRDRMGDILTIDDLGGRPLHNPAILEGWTMTAEELAR